MDRPLCLSCNQRFRAVNCHKNGKIYYRKQCDYCLKRRKRLPVPVPRWAKTGYVKKPACDRCGFRGRHARQLLVYHIDGNMNNSNYKNLKTVCQNCAIDIAKLDLPWQAGDLEPDC
jgi:hypothetical protein